ncbi:MAG: c-type cytochrome [Bryobacteraceae bacterium]
MLGVSACLAQSPNKNPYDSSPREAEAGRGAFRIYCAPCHGIKAEGGRGPDLTRGVYAVGETDADLYQVIAEGIAGTEMPGFGVNMGEDNIWRVVTYIRSTTRKDREPVQGDASVGEKLYWGKGACGQCHRIGQRGGRTGPELTRTGRTRSLAYLRASVLTPDSDLTPGYNTVTVTTRDGRKIIGVEKGFDNFSAQLMDADERFHSFLKSDVASVTREFRSLMPQGYGKMFSQTELNDLLAYMTGLTGEVRK